MNFFQRSPAALETIARNVINSYDPHLLYAPAPIPVEAIMEKVYGLTIEYHLIRKNTRILGETIFEDCEVPIYERANGEGYKMIPVKAGTVIIDARLLHKGNDGRHNYTLGHELSHWVLDRSYFIERGEMAAMTNKAVRSSDTDKAVERQANLLCSYILMPKAMVKKAFYQYRSEFNAAAILANLFKVSNQAMEIRLREMGLLA